jgi:ubiquinone/menaquinone biosynthesis C-methylase UbiE
LSSTKAQGPSPELFFETATAFQRSAALKAAVDVELFTAIGEGNSTTSQIAARCQASERGVRILCDYLTIVGFLAKTGDAYALTPDSAVFLDRRSPAYLGSALDFLNASMLKEGFDDLVPVVRTGTCALPGDGSVEPENPVWVTFARAMAPMMAMPARFIAETLDPNATAPLRILDIAAGHGLFGLAFAERNPSASVTALDWLAVLEVAKENAARVGVSERYDTIPGSAFGVEFGEGYDLILLTNFLHHFDTPTCESLLKKVRASLAPAGRALILEFVPNDDRVSPPMAATFALTMLACTPAGDAYTYAELDRMCVNAGFARTDVHAIQPGIQSIVVAHV